VYSLYCNQNSACQANFSSAEDMAGPEKKAQHCISLKRKTNKNRPTTVFNVLLKKNKQKKKQQKKPQNKHIKFHPQVNLPSH